MPEPKVTTISTGYTARWEFEKYHARKQRWSCIVAHRRVGKTVAHIADVLDGVLRCPLPSPRGAYIAPLFVQAKDVAWGYLKTMTRMIPGVSFNETELRVDLPGDRRVRLYGMDNPDRMRGIYLDEATVDEYADMIPSAFGEVIRPALADRGGRASFIGTPKGRDAFFEMCEYARHNPAEWFFDELKASETGRLSVYELADARASMTPEQYEQEFEASFNAAIMGAYYGREIAELERSGRIGDVPYTVGLPVHTAWDLGIGDSTSIWFWQVVGNELYVIDHYEANNQPMAHYAAILSAKPYKYGAHFVPHDAANRDPGSGRSLIETMQQLFGKRPRLLRRNKIMDGINALRVTMPASRWDMVKCRGGLEALRQYRSNFDEKTRAFSDTPRHDWTSHAADAARYMALAWREPRVPDIVAVPKYAFTGRVNGGMSSTQTLNEIIARQTRARKQREGAY